MDQNDVKPIMINKFSFKKQSLSNVDCAAGLDRGCSLTKIIYVDKSDKESLKPESNNAMVPLTVALFSNDDFEAAVKWLNDNAAFPDDTALPFHVTGAGGVKYSETIKKVLSRDVLFIDEFMSQSRGAYNLLVNVPTNELTFPAVEPKVEYKLSIPNLSSLKDKFIETVGEKVMKQPKEQILPCIFGFMGSGGGFAYISEDGKFRMVSALPTAGKTFVGLCRCILGTNKYNEIMEMAERGDRRNVDSQTKELVTDIPDWEKSPDMPVFSMGKLAETINSITEFNKDDIALSLVSMFTFNIMNAGIHLCMIEKVKNIFFGGNLFQGEIFRKEFESNRRQFNIDFINFYFVNNGHTGALGAMMSKPADMEKYFKS